MLALLPSSLLLLAAPLFAQAAVHDLYWTVSYAQHVNPDTLISRRVVGINGTWPPPPIFVTQNDTLRIHAKNGLEEGRGTSIHSHGIFFNGSSWSDGAAGVTQCPIPFGETFTYEIPTDLNIGTYWVHSHFSGQYVDGLRTPLIISPAIPRTDVTWDDEYVVILSDWYSEEHDALKDVFMSKYNPTGAEPVPASLLLYLAQDGQYLHSNEDLSNGVGISDGAVMKFEKGKTYKIRVINMSALSMFTFWLDGHEMQIIEVDGVDTKPYLVENVGMAVGQRYSFLVKARDDPDGWETNWVMHANSNPTMYDVIPDELNLNISATITYEGAQTRELGTTVDEYEFFNDMALVPLVPIPIVEADVSIDMTFGLEVFSDGSNRGWFNKITYETPLVPSIFTAASMGNDSFNSAIYGVQTHAHTLQHNQMVELVVVNTDDGEHPFHLHGHTFFLVHRSYDVESDDPKINPPVQEGQLNPMRRDTVMIPPGGSTTIRFRTDNPGVWLFHCHVDWHLTAGLASVFVVAPDKMQESIKFPQFMLDQCAAQGMPTTGNAVGRNSTTDLEGQVLGPFELTMGWDRKAITAMAMCILTALLGIFTVVFYARGQLTPEECVARERVESEHRKKKAKGKGRR